LTTRREGTGIGTIRRHQCRSCGHRFYTFQPDPTAIQSHQIQWSERIPWLRQP
jgi:transcriptional regulator NrdR family protein